MFGACPNCKSRRLRYSHPKDAWEAFRGWLGIIAVRCRDCRHRFFRSVWDLSMWKYAYCPRCFRTDLGFWSEAYHRPSFEQRFLLRLGAKRYRCEVCRHNFTSFGRLKARFRFARRERSEAASAGGRTETATALENGAGDIAEGGRQTKNGSK